ncbi:MAG: bifunctional phosphoglucose/phosphomannose isomerase, partial [Desulfurococcaceae archaeon]|nr:bifunctional phosphoglucose/phosphomannose isomerase [Desulfurococcaceae archaeon]
MLEQYTNWYSFALEALNYKAENVRSFKDVKRVIVVGMGGSGIVGDMLSVIAQVFTRIPVYV